MPMDNSYEEEESNGDASFSKRRKNQSPHREMFSYYWEFIFAFCVLLTSFAAMQNSQLKISKGPTPIPFFHQTSFVADFFAGDLSSAVERGTESDITCVMYYAPWDAESQALRSQFKTVAQYYHKEIFFAAINCWQPLSECKRQFSKVLLFPVVMAYTKDNKGIRYSGLREAPHIIRFLKYIMRPLERIETAYDMVRLLSKYDALVIGHIDFTGNYEENYDVFYSVALKFLETDPHREIGFAVVTSADVAWELQIYRSPTVRLVVWNGTVEYSSDEPFKESLILKWISSNLQQISVWVSPPGVKSLVLSSYVQEGSALILFTPRNPFEEENYSYNLLREVILDYFNCKDNPWMKEVSHYLAIRRTESRAAYASLEKRCSSFKEELGQRNEVLSVQVADKWWSNRSCCSNDLSSTLLCEFEDQCTVEEKSKGINYDSNKDLCHTKIRRCSVQREFQGPLTRESLCGHKEGLKDASSDSNSFQTSMLTGIGDEKSASELKNSSLRETCRRFEKAKLVHSPVFPRTSYKWKSNHNITGLACRTNSSTTLSFLTMDSLHYQQFAEGLGIPVSLKKDKTVAVIFSAVEEKSYVLDVGVSKGALIDFIVNYTRGELNRFMRSSDQKPRSGALNTYPVISWNMCDNTKTATCIMELTTSTFQKVVMDPHMNVLVFYHSSFCTFCQSVSYVYLTVARYFKAVDNLLFTRIDGEHNDLPWEYTMPRYPTIIFFPEGRKVESRVFPQNIPVTAPNLVNFILANAVSEEEKLKFEIALCVIEEDAPDSLASISKECIRHARMKSIEMISDILSKYRVTLLRMKYSVAESAKAYSEFHNKFRYFLQKLQFLKEINLLLGSVGELNEQTNSTYKQIRTIIHNLKNI